MRERILIIGSGMAAALLLEELAARRCTADLTVVGAEAAPSYNRIPLASLLHGDIRTEELALLDPEWYRRHGVRLVTGDPIARIDLAAREARTESGLRLGFDRLVFATGARAHVPAIPGVQADGVMSFRSLADLDAIRSKAVEGAAAAVIGGGLLGLEAAHGLLALGLRVTVVHRHEHLMNRQLDRAAARVVQRELERRGIRFVLGTSPAAVAARDGRVSEVELESGASVPARLVIFAAGIEPEYRVAADAGIPCGRAIQVDRRLCSTVPGVHALGECCEIDARTVGLVAPIRSQAAVLADVLTGCATTGYVHADASTLLKVSGIDVFSAGALPFPHDADEQVLLDETGGVYRRLVFQRGRLIGAMLVGDRSGSSWYAELIAGAADVSAIRPLMMFGRAFCESGAPAVAN